MTKGLVIILAVVLLSFILAIVFGVEAVRCKPPCI